MTHALISDLQSIGVQLNSAQILFVEAYMARLGTTKPTMAAVGEPITGVKAAQLVVDEPKPLAPVEKPKVRRQRDNSEVAKLRQHDAEIRAMAAMRNSRAQIGARFGVTSGVVSRYVDKHEIKLHHKKTRLDREMRTRLIEHMETLFAEGKIPAKLAFTPVLTQIAARFDVSENFVNSLWTVHMRKEAARTFKNAQ